MAIKNYGDALISVVAAAGMLSRAGVASAMKQIGFDNATSVKKALTKALGDRAIALDDSSYTLAGDCRAAAGAQYELKYKAAVKARAEARAGKAASKKRAEKQYARNLKAAGGLTDRAKADKAWMAR